MKYINLTQGYKAMVDDDDSKEDAYRVYRESALKHFGEFAYV